MADESSSGNYTKPGLRERIKSQVMAGSDGGKPGQWSARKAQLVAQKYKERGGGYKGGKSEAQKSLSKWTKQEWTTSDGKPAERPGGTTRYLPKDSWKKLSPGERSATNAKKREGSREGRQFVANTEAAAEARKEAMEHVKEAAVSASLWRYGLGKLAAEHKNASVLHALAHGAAMTLGGHVGTNAMGRAAHHGSNIAEILAHKGVQHGLLGAGTQITPARLQSIKMMFGPEATVPYELALKSARNLLEKVPNPEARRLALQRMYQHGTGLENVPVASDVRKAIAHELAGTSPALQAQTRGAKIYGKLLDHLSKPTTNELQTGAQKVVKNITGAAPLAGFVAADAAASAGIPIGAIGHMGWNLTRQGAVHTPVGKRLLGDEVRKGLRGQQVSKTKEFVIDHLMSPAYLDARRAALQAHKANPAGAQALATDPFLDEVIQQGPGAVAKKFLGNINDLR